MGWLADTFKAMLGFDQEDRAYRDSLAAAERRVHWGTEHRSQSDLLECLRLLANCPPAKAPNAHYAYRRHRAEAAAHVGVAGQVIDGLQQKVKQLTEYFANLEDGRQSLMAQAEGLRARVAELETEGSLISAREERRRLEEMDREVHDLPNLAEEKAAKRKTLLEEVQPLYRRHRKAADGSVAAMRALKGLTGEDAEICSKLADKFDRDLAQADTQWKTAEESVKQLLG